MQKQKLLLLLAGMLMALPVVARDFSYEHEGKTITYTVIDEDAKTCKTKAGSTAAAGNAVEGSLTLPANPVDGTTTYTLTEIGDYSFIKCGSLSAIYIPNTVTTIGVQAFRSCTGLTSVVVPPSVTDLDEDAFWLCTGLEKSAYPEHLYNPFESGVAIKFPTDATITPDGVIYDADITKLYFAPYNISGEFIIPSTVTAIGQAALLDCNAVTRIVIPESVTTIGARAFQGCGYLSELIFEDNDSPIDMPRDAFTSCHASNVYLGRNISIPNDNLQENKTSVVPGITTLIIGNTVTSIPSYLFFRCSGLTSVEIGNSVETIGIEAFSGCTSLTSVVIGNSVKTIGMEAFNGCTSLTSVVIGNSVKTIGSEAFKGCTSLTGELIIPNSVESIEISAFFGCDSLTSMVIGSSIKEIKARAFWGCNSLASVKILATHPPTVYYKKLGDLATFPAADHSINLEIPNNTATDYLKFYKDVGFSKLKVGGIPAELCSIGNFEYLLINNPDNPEAIISEMNASLTDVEIPERITDDRDPENPVRYYITAIGMYAFKSKSVKTVTFSSRTRVSAIGEYAFDHCPLTSIDIPNSVTSIGNHAFGDCSDLTSVVIGNSVETIGDWAFGYCSGLTSVVIPNSVQTIGNGVFGGCSGLTSIEIPNSVKTIGNEAFRECSGLTSVVIGNSVKTIGNEAFIECRGLTSVLIGNSVQTIGDRAFYGCTGLTSLEIGNSVQTIGDRAFYGCSGLQKVEFASIESLFNIKFEGSDSNPLRRCPENLYINGEKLTDLVIPEGVTAIGDDFFSGCTGLTSVEIGNSVQTIGDQAFSDCTGLTSLEIGNSVKTIGDHAFSDCTGLTSVVIPNSVQTIGNGVFGGCSGLTSLIIGNSLQTIGNDAFYGCHTRKLAYPNTIETPCGSTITICYPAEDAIIEDGVIYGADKTVLYFVALSYEGDFMIPQSVTTIGNEAFAYCNNLTSVTIPKSVTSLGSRAFLVCSKLTNVYSLNPEAPSVDDNNNALTGIPTTAVVYVPKGSVGKYASAKGWSRFRDIRELDSLLELTISEKNVRVEIGKTAEISVTAVSNAPSSLEPFIVAGTEQWTSQNEAVATVDGGTVTAVGAGTTTITYSVEDCLGYTHAVSCEVTVLPILVESITITPDVWKGVEGDYTQLVAVVLPDNATDKSLTWTSSDELVARVDDAGVVYLYEEGTCIITATANDGSGVEGQCTVTRLHSGIEAIYDDCDTSVDVYSIGGELLKKGCDKSQLQHLAPGMYILRNIHKAVKVIMK